MNPRFLKTTLYATAAASLGLAGPAFAAGSTGAEEIIVTARRMEERLQDVPISITVYNQQQLDNRNITSGAELADYTPSLTADRRFGSENATFAIRGFTQEIRTTASVGVYFADVVAPRGGGAITSGGDGAGPGAFFDLQNVQVLKGPQGTLFGRNTTGGAVLLVPKKPVSEFGGYLEGSFGNYDMKRVQGVLNTPLGEKARLRLGFDRMARDGYLENISGAGPSRFGDADYYAGRASLVVDITPKLENYTIFSFSRSDTNGSVPHVFACNPAPTGFGSIAPFLCPGQLAQQAGRDIYTVQNSFPNPQTVVEQWQVINTTTWQATDLLTIKNIVSYAQFKGRQSGTFYGENFYFPNTPPFTFFGVGGLPYTLNFSNPEPGFNRNHQATLTEELQFQGRSRDSKFVWQAGGYMELSDPLHPVSTFNPNNIVCTNFAAFQCNDILGTLSGGLLRGGIGRTKAEISFRNLGIYGQGTYNITEQLKLTAGVRYTADVTEANSQQFAYAFFVPNVPFPNCVDPNANDATATDPVNGCRVHFKKSSDRPTWVIDLEYAPTQELMVYAKYARGYRQGGVVPAAPSGFETYGPETVDTYEAGAKTSFRGAISGTFNVAAFYNDFADQQLQLGLLNFAAPGSPATTAIQNAGKSRIFGAEIESSLNLFKGFRLDLSGAYLDSKLEKLEPPPASTLAGLIVLPTSVPGTVLPLTPRYKASVTGTYKLPLSEAIGEVLIGATYTYTGKNLIAPTSPYGYHDAQNLVNLNLNWNSIGGGPVDAAFFVTNLLEEEYYSAIRGGWSSFGFETGIPGEPRMYGMRIRLNYGG